MSGNRQRLLALIRENPGIFLQEIADRIGLTRTAVIHHVRNLENKGLITTVRQGRRVTHFGAKGLPPVERSMLGLLRLRTVRLVIEALQQNPTLSWRKLAKQLDATPHTVRWQIARLQREGVLEVLERSDGDGHIVRLHPSLTRMGAAPPALPSDPGPGFPASSAPDEQRPPSAMEPLGPR